MKTLLITLFCLFSHTTWANQIMSLAYSTTNVTTGAYVTLATTTIQSSRFYICDTSGQVMKLATGAVGSEVDFVTMPISSCTALTLDYMVPATRLSLKAISASATTGFATVSVLP